MINLIQGQPMPHCVTLNPTKHENTLDRAHIVQLTGKHSKAIPPYRLRNNRFARQRTDLKRIPITLTIGEQDGKSASKNSSTV